MSINDNPNNKIEQNANPIVERKYYPLTHAQKRIYYDEKIFSDSPWANNCFIVKYQGRMDFELLAKVINRVILKNEGLRLRFVELDYEPGPSQYVFPYRKVELDHFDFSGPNSERRLQDWTTKTSQIHFNLIDSDLFYFACIKFNENEYGYYIKLHHLISDGWSFFLLFSEIDKIYEALKDGKKIHENPNPSYIEYIKDEQDYLNSDQFKEDRKFWHGNLLPLPEPLNLSLKIGNNNKIESHDIICTVPSDLRIAMHEYCNNWKTSLYKIVLTALSVYIADITGYDDIVISGGSHNRSTDISKKIIGMLVSTLAFRITIDREMTFNSLVEKTGKEVNDIIKKHQKYPFDLLATELKASSGREIGFLRNLSLVGHSDVEKNRFEYEHILPGYEPGDILIHLNLSNKDKDGILELEYVYQIEKFSVSDIKRIHNGLVNVLTDAFTHPQKAISEIEILSADEKQQIFYDFNKTETDYPKDKTIHRLFEEQVEKTPDNPAIISQHNRITYRELNQKANPLARALRQKGVQSGGIVQIMVKRSIEMIAGILAILKAGGAYLPIEPERPEEQVHYILNENRGKLLVTESEYIRIVDYQREIITIDKEALYQDGDRNLDIPGSPSHVASMIYIFGYKGKPKVAAVEHAAIANTLFDIQNAYPIEENDAYLLKMPFHSGMSVIELFGWFLKGGKLFLLEKKNDTNPQNILHAIYQWKITHITFAPTLFNRLVNLLDEEQMSKLASLKYLFLSGEAFVWEPIRRFTQLKSEVTIVNVHGTAETSIYAHSKFLPEILNGHRPVKNTKIYILNFINGKPVLLPIGVPGEICISGIGLPKEYLERSAIMSAKFMVNPFVNKDDSNNPYYRLYRTGELGYRLPEGTIRNSGRIKRLARIKGTRIIRAEIENLLLKECGLQEAIVVIREDKKKGKYLCAYIVANETVDTSILRDTLSKSLPAHALPSYFIQLDEIPLTPEGKADRVVLSDFMYDPQQVQDILTDIQAEVMRLNKEDINVDDNFFKLGGQSVHAVEMVSKIQKALDMKISMSEIFKKPTLRQLSEFLARAVKVKYSSLHLAESKEYYPQTSAQKRLYFLQQMGEQKSTVYHIQAMDIYYKKFNQEKFEWAIRSLIKRHESLRTSFHMEDGEAVQRIYDSKGIEENLEIEYYEATEEGQVYTWLPGQTEKQKTEENLSFDEVKRNFVRPFNLDIPPLFRVGVIKIMYSTMLLMFDIHHMIADGISLGILIKEFWEFYDGTELPPLRFQYRDFAEWLNSEGRAEEIKEQEEFWLNEFKGELPLLNMPLDYFRPARLTPDGDVVRFEIDGLLTSKLKKIAKERGETLYMILLAIYNILVSKLSGQEELIIGTITPGRSHEYLQDIVGMFLNTLAIRNYPRGEKTLDNFFMEVKLNIFAVFENQDYPFEQLASKVAPREDNSRNPLFDVVFGVENESIREGYVLDIMVSDNLNPYHIETKKSKFDMTLICAEIENALECSIEYRTKLFKKETIERFSRYFQTIIFSVCQNINQKISQVDIIPGEEKEQILYGFNHMDMDYPKDKTIHEIVEAHVRKNPHNLAVVMADEKLTYQELNEKSNRLAVILREKGVGPDCIVALMTGRTLELIIAQLGILKAGGAYLSIDIGLPEARKKFLLEDSHTEILLARKDYLNQNKEEASRLFDGPILAVDDETLYGHLKDEASNPVRIMAPDNMAYVIYTSGTTGKPKGVMMHHRGIVSLNKCSRERFGLDESSRVLQFASVSFDASVWEVWMALMNGGTLVLVDTDTIQNYERFVAYINQAGVTVALLPPIYVNHINPDSLKSLNILLTGGAAAGSEMVEKWRRQVQYVNCYGPTESSICCTMWKASKTGDPVTNPPIGISVSNTRIHIIDKNNHLVPIGVCGELCVSGFHVAIGYLNRPELTDERFVPDPIVKGNRMYRTGDLVRWMPDGNIEYFGRIDFQVKIRGFRIEPGEIENCIARHAKIKDVAVLALENKDKGEKYLCAYIVPREKITIMELKDYLHGELPEYMVPSYFVRVETIPLNSSGKVDKKALPEPQIQVSESDYKAPENEIQIQLADAWQKVLGMERIGIQDDFFTLGGDSIKAIQIVSRLQKNKLKLEVNQMFLHKTIEELDRYVKPVETAKLADQGMVSGNVELTPIQRWFFKNHQTYGHHFNQSVTLYRKARLNETYIKKIFSKLVEHHDALRMVYQFEGDAVLQNNRGIEGKLFDLEVIALDGKEDEKIIQKQSLRINGSIDWENGPLVKLALFKGEQGDHLLIVIHHLVVDGVSWRILLDDFESAYLQLDEGKKIAFQEKTDSFKVWAKRLTDYSQDKILLNQLPYWNEIEGKKVERLPVDHEMKMEDRKFGDNEIIRLELPQEKTVQLLTKVNGAYNTEINDILLMALGLSIKEWARMDSVLVNLEGHGREQIIEDVNINRTVGWFTTQYPVVLDMATFEDLSFCIKNVKETLRRVPQKGIGYGILKYLTPEEKGMGIEFHHVPEIVFNYLGQFGGEKFKVIDRVSGITDLVSLKDSFSPEFRVSQKIDIEGVIDANVLKLFFFYNPGDYEKESIEKLVNIFRSSLMTIIDHCAAKKDKELTPSDLGYPKLPVHSLDEMTEGLKKRISEEIEIEAIYSLTAFQQEMFRSTLVNRESYLVQNIFLLPAQAPSGVLEEAFNQLIERHAVFRTVFLEEKTTGPLQVVLKKRSMKIEWNDVSLLDDEDKRYRIDQIKVKDRQRGFDLAVDLPLRLIRVITGEAVDQLIWSVNHIVIDGWCLEIIMNDLLSLYEGIMDGRPVPLESVIPYRNYVEWLEHWDMAEGLTHWRDYLSGYPCDSSTLSRLGKKRDAGNYRLEEHLFTLDEVISEGLARVASEQQVTLNILFQVMWGIRLQHYLQRDDAIFGSIVSGRSANVESIEKIVGLFINIVPVRIKISEITKFHELLKRVQEQSIQAKRYENLPLCDVLAQASLSQGAIDNLMFFENYSTEGEAGQNTFSGKTLSLQWIENHEQIDYSFCFYVMPGKSIRIRFQYNARVYEREFIEKVAADFNRMAKQVIAKPDLDLNETN
ncbi:MAG: amino acid adenylation domain-containing protein [Candidatus Omnitrophota bacterium]